MSERRNLSARTRMVVVVRDRCVCQICGQLIADGAEVEIDHVHPVHRGGTNALTNLRTTHRACNQSRDYESDADWLRVERWMSELQGYDGDDDAFADAVRRPGLDDAWPGLEEALELAGVGPEGLPPCAPPHVLGALLLEVLP